VRYLPVARSLNEKQNFWHKNNSIENGKGTEPEQEFLVRPSAENIHCDSSGTESCSYSTDDPESYGIAHE
jgi:hypothetical protein